MTVQLPTWQDGRAKSAIVQFVEGVTDPRGDGFVPPEERVAVFDNDGTLWCEKPMQIQLQFTLGRLAEMARSDASLSRQQPWKAASEGDFQWFGEAITRHYKGDDRDLRLLMGAIPRSFAALTVEAYAERVLEFFHGSHPVLDRPLLACGYQPMVELMRFLEANGFTNYIASGGDRDFMRPVASMLYNIPPERVIGSSLALEYRTTPDGNDVLYKDEMEFFDDGPTKPVRIWSRIGRRPLVACGNANGDIPMLRFAGGSSRPALRLLVLHDDNEREFGYTSGAEDALNQARANDWTVVSIKNDWATVFDGATASPGAA